MLSAAVVIGALRVIVTTYCNENLLSKFLLNLLVKIFRRQNSITTVLLNASVAFCFVLFITKLH